VDISAGGFHGVGARLDLDQVTTPLTSEFGAYGHVFYMQMSAFL
jgi:hypothetical protein